MAGLKCGWRNTNPSDGPPTKRTMQVLDLVFIASSGFTTTQCCCVVPQVPGATAKALFSLRLKLSEWSAKSVLKSGAPQLPANFKVVSRQAMGWAADAPRSNGSSTYESRCRT